MGMHFALKPNEIPIETLIVDMETTISMCDDEDVAGSLRREISTAITEFNSTPASNNFKHNI